jgi:hypothetical protein
MAEEKLNLQITIDTEAGEKNVDNLNKKTKESAKAAKEGQGAFSTLGNTIKSLGVISVIAGAFNFFKETLSKNQKVADSVAAVFNTISTIINKLVDIFIEVTAAVSKNTNGFDALGKVMTGLLTLAITPLKLAFGTIKLFIQEAQLAWEDSFLGGKDADKIKELTKNISDTKKFLGETADGAVEAGKKVYNNFGAAAASVVDVVSGVVDKASKINVKAVYEQSKATIALQNNAKLAAAELAGLVEKYDRQAETLRQVRDDEFKSIDDRIAANNKLGGVLNEQEIAMKKLAATKVAAAAAELAQNKTSIDLQVALKEAMNEQAGIEAQVAGLRSEYLVNQTALAKEKLAIDASVAASANKISLDERKANAELIKDELLKLETKKQIAQEESDLELKRLQENIDNANAGTQAKADADIAYAEKKAEIDNQILALDDSINAAKLDREVKARSEKEALLVADYELSKALGEAKFEDELNLYNKTRELERQNIEARMHTASELEAFDKQTALGRVQIEKTTQETKLAIVENALGAVADAVGRESAAGKAFAVAQAVMNTYSAANKAMTAYPPPFSFIAAGTTVLAGLMNVKKIISTPLPNSKGGTSSAGASVSMSAPVAPPLPQAQTTNISQASINDMGNQAVKAYVIESDVSSNQQRIAAIRQRARFS